MHTHQPPRVDPIQLPTRTLARARHDAMESIQARARMEGVVHLADTELLALLLAALGNDRGAPRRAAHLLETLPLPALLHARIPELQDAAHLDERAALALAAAVELGARMHRPPPAALARIHAPADVAAVAAPHMVHLPRERMLLMLLDQGHRLRSTVMVAEGWREGLHVDPREVFRPALAERASALVLVHNHPSGDPTPSRADVELTRRLSDGAALLGFRLVDHVVVAHGGHASVPRT